MFSIPRFSLLLRKIACLILVKLVPYVSVQIRIKLTRLNSNYSSAEMTALPLTSICTCSYLNIIIYTEPAVHKYGLWHDQIQLSIDSRYLLAWNSTIHMLTITKRTFVWVTVELLYSVWFLKLVFVPLFWVAVNNFFLFYLRELRLM